VLERAGVTLDTTRHTAARDGLVLNLSPKEFAVLQVLLRAGGQVISAEDLLEQAWDENADPFTNSVRVTIMTLRRKLGDPPVVDTVVGAGYRIAPDNTDTADAADPGAGDLAGGRIVPVERIEPTGSAEAG
jgi:DNA-binding response OmpR family regulator